MLEFFLTPCAPLRNLQIVPFRLTPDMLSTCIVDTLLYRYAPYMYCRYVAIQKGLSWTTPKSLKCWLNLMENATDISLILGGLITIVIKKIFCKQRARDFSFIVIWSIVNHDFPPKTHFSEASSSVQLHCLTEHYQKTGVSQDGILKSV